jgi:hypothetical protein
VPRNRPNPAIKPGRRRAVRTRSGAISVPPTRSRSYSGRAIERTAAMREVPWLSRALAPKHQQNSGISRPTKNQQRWLSRRSSGTATTTLLGDACHPMLPFLAGRRAGRQRRGRTRALSISEAGALSDSLGPIRDGTASAHRQGLTADQAYRTISYDGLATPIAVQLCGGAGGARARDQRIRDSWFSLTARKNR